MSALLNSAGFQHLIAGLAIIGAVAALAATGTINGTDALGLIAAVGSFLLGGTLANSSASNAIAAVQTPSAPQPVAPALPVAVPPAQQVPPAA